MEWRDEEVQEKKKMSLSSKVLLGIIACVVVIIILLIILLLNMQKTSLSVFVDGLDVSVNVDKNTIVTKVDDVTYVNIEDFSKLVGYEYHKGEYKSYIIEEDKCYVEGKKETATFYLNDNVVYKLLLNERDKQYEEYEMKDTIKSINNEMYASIEAISKAFNVLVDYKNGQFQIYTLDYLVTLYDNNVKQWGYTSIKDQSFENSKALLQGYLIVKKDGGLYKIIDSNNTKEIVLDRYTSIEFSENMQEFFVTDSLKKVGIVNLDGTVKIEPSYDSIKVLDKQANLYIVELAKKYGVISGNGRSIIYPEYDSIGVSDSNIADNKYLLLDELIPVCKNKKWGAFNKSGNLILNVEYDQFGYTSTSIEIDGVKEVVQPVLTIERANGVVVKKENKYGLFSVTGEELVRIAVDGIYSINGIEDEDSKYFMLYNGEELNVIQRLIKAGLIKDNTNNKEEIQDTIQNETVTDNSITTNTITNTVVNDDISNTEV